MASRWSLGFGHLTAAFLLACSPSTGHAQESGGPNSANSAYRDGTHSMAVGGVTANSARFRVHSATADSVNIELSPNTQFTPSRFGTTTWADNQRHNVVLIDLDGLESNQLYHYRAWIAGMPQPVVQSFRTFPAPGTPATFTFAFGSCQQSGSLLPSVSRGNVFYAVSKSGASLFLQIGDWGYPDSVDSPPVDNNFFSANYDLVQQSYLTRFDRDYPMDSVISTMPVDYVFDDHDYMNNNSSATTSSYSIPFRPNPLGSNFAIMELPNPPGARENSLRGYRENMPAYPLGNESRGIYHKFTVGSAEFFMLDLRSQRSPNLESFSLNSSTGKWQYKPPPGHSMLASPSAPGTGPDQISWLVQGLKSSTAKWKFLVSSVPFNQGQAAALMLGVILQDSVINSIPGIPPGTSAIAAALEFCDKWVGFPADVDTLLNTIRQHNISNVIVLSGDAHTAAMDDGTNAGLPEIMAGGLDIANSRLAAGFASLGMNIWNKGGQGLTTPLFNNAFGKVTVFGTDSVLLELVDEEETVFASHTIRDAKTSVSEGSRLPSGFALYQNYPNPFNPETVVGSQLPVPSDVKLAIYDLLGREVAVLVNERRAAGSYQDTFLASGLASGTYICRLKAGAYVQSRTMVLLR